MLEQRQSIIDLDGQLRGERIALRVTTPGVTFALGNNLDMDGNTMTARVVYADTVSATTVYASDNLRAPSVGTAIANWPCDFNHRGDLRHDLTNGNFYGCSNDANDNGSTGDWGWVKLNN